MTNHFHKDNGNIYFTQCPNSLGLEQIDCNILCCLYDQQYIRTHQITQTNIVKTLVYLINEQNVDT